MYSRVVQSADITLKSSREYRYYALGSRAHCCPAGLFPDSTGLSNQPFRPWDSPEIIYSRVLQLQVSIKRLQEPYNCTAGCGRGTSQSISKDVLPSILAIFKTLSLGRSIDCSCLVVSCTHPSGLCELYRGSAGPILVQHRLKIGRGQ